MKGRQKKLDAVRIQIPYFHIRAWKDIPLGRIEALEKLEEIQIELKASLDRIEKQIAGLEAAEREGIT